jgi:N utilization substance protein B
MNPTARRHSRHYALQAIYQWQVSGATASQIEAEFIKHQIKKKVDIEYFKESLHYVIQNASELDNEMVSFLNRPVKELDMIELAILRLAIFEFKHRLDVPYRVVLNEALELAKKFGSIEGFKFVNAILDQVAKKCRATEVTAHRK